MLYCSWDTECDRCNYFSFWAIFCPFSPPLPPISPVTTQKIKIKKKWNKHLEKSSFYTSEPKIMIICYTVLEVWHVLFFILVYFLPFYPLTVQKIKISKKRKEHLKISSLYLCVPKIIIRWCMVPEIWCITDGQTEKLTSTGGCHT